MQLFGGYHIPSQIWDMNLLLGLQGEVMGVDLNKD